MKPGKAQCDPNGKFKNYGTPLSNLFLKVPIWSFAARCSSVNREKYDLQLSEKKQYSRSAVLKIKQWPSASNDSSRQGTQSESNTVKPNKGSEILARDSHNGILDIHDAQGWLWADSENS